MKYVHLCIATVLVVGVLLSLPSGRSFQSQIGVDAPLHLANLHPAASVSSRQPQLHLAFGRHVPTPAPLPSDSRPERQTVFVTVEVEGANLEIGLFDRR